MNWDNRLDPLGVKHVPNMDTLEVIPAPNPTAIWQLDSAVFQDEQEAQGNHIILFTVLDDQGKPCPGVNCFVDWIGRDAGDVPTKAVTDKNGQANVPIYANLDIHKLNGPYFAYIDSPNKSDKVTGMGLPEHHHVNYLLTFEPRVAQPEPTPQPQPKPEPPQPALTLPEAALAAAKAVPWMPVNNTAALWQFAQAHNLQDQQTDEIPFKWNGQDYIAQVFDLGIIYVQVGDWGNIKIIPK